MTDIVLVRATEWEGLYIDGVLQNEGDSVPADRVIAAVGGKTIYLTSAQDQRIFKDGGTLPTNLREIGL